MMKHYAVFINFMGSGKPLTTEVEARLATFAPDWLRWAPGQYLLPSSQSVEAIYSAIRPALHANDFILIVEVTLRNRAGWAQKVALDWFTKHSP